MSGASAAGTLAEVRAKQLERNGQKLSEAEKSALHEEIRAAYDEQADPRYGAARLWIDAIIDPAKTRDVLIEALEVCSLNPDVPRFNPGVLQT
jgi:3-methylcrotonyl-CoA carboxylase beta subunit